MGKTFIVVTVLSECGEEGRRETPFKSLRKAKAFLEDEVDWAVRYAGGPIVVNRTGRKVSAWWDGRSQDFCFSASIEERDGRKGR